LLEIHCNTYNYEYFIKGTEPKKSCTPKSIEKIKKELDKKKDKEKKKE